MGAPKLCNQTLSSSRLSVFRFVRVSLQNFLLPAKKYGIFLYVKWVQMMDNGAFIIFYVVNTRHVRRDIWTDKVISKASFAHKKSIRPDSWLWTAGFITQLPQIRKKNIECLAWKLARKWCSIQKAWVKINLMINLLYYSKCKFPMIPSVCLSVGCLVGLLVGVSQFPKKSRKLHFHSCIGALVPFTISMHNWNSYLIFATRHISLTANTGGAWQRKLKKVKKEISTK